MRTGFQCMLAAALLAGCAIHDTVHEEGAVPERAGRADAVPDVHVVRRGDSLYAIAFRYGLDYRDLAAWNGIRPPYTIYPDQEIRLTAPATVAATSPGSEPGPTPLVVEDVTPSGHDAAGEPGRRAEPRPSNPEAVAVTRPTVAVVEEPPVPELKTAPPEPEPAPPRPGELRWFWPTAGALTGRFSSADSGRQGIEISGHSGQPVRAAAAGEIVYSGSGLIGYGELIIIKHNEEYLSAYGNNRRRVVGEGQRVAAGDLIAEMGEDGGGNAVLHFEIRRDGTPVDPLDLLPAR